MRLEKIEVGRLIPYINNARTHSADQLLKLRASLREFGFVNPILVDKNLNVIAGHGRIEAAKAEGMTEVPCVFVEHLTEAQKRAYILADNRLAELAGWDEELLKIELAALKEMDFDISPFGFEEFDFSEPDFAEENFDVEAELAKPAVAQLGDVWTLGRHRIICGDSTKPETYAKLLRGEKVQLVLTDPPYFVDLDSTAGKILNDDLNDEDGLKFLTAAIENLRDSATNDASFYIFYATAKTRIFYDAFEACGLYPLAGLVWKKDALVLTRTDYKYIHEPIAFLKKRKGTHKWYGDNSQTTVLEFDRIKNSATEGFGHPSSKPVELLGRLVQNSSKRGDKILDAFLGSASTLIAAENLGRTCYGIELCEKFVDVAVNRFASAVGSTEKIFVERGGEKFSFNEISP